MQRTASPPEPTPESFARLLDRLTQRVQTGSSVADLAPDRYVPSGKGKAALAETRRRVFAPVAEVKASQGEAVQLSYERALRIHGRTKPLTDTALTSPAAHASGDTRAVKPQPMANPHARRDLKKGTRTVPTEEAQAATSPPAVSPATLQKAGSQKTKTAARTHELQAVSQTRPAPSPSSRVAREQSLAAPGSKRGHAEGAAKPGPVARAASGTRGSPQRQAKRAADANAQRAVTAPLASPLPPMERAATQKVRAPHAGQNRRSETSTAKKARKSEPRLAELHLEMVPRNYALEHRTAVVSIRLSDAEFDQLRQRASESGISVSAYMRSCVLEAENLRSQVKQALTAMRSSISSSSSMRPVELGVATNPLATRIEGLGVNEASPSMGNGWSKFLWRSATFFFGPWFPFRSRV